MVDPKRERESWRKVRHSGCHEAEFPTGRCPAVQVRCMDMLQKTNKTKASWPELRK